MERGDIWLVKMEPSEGREIQGTRPCLIVSQRSFNRLGMPLVCPITTGGDLARRAGWAVSLTGAVTQTQGVILTSQVRTMDIAARKGRKIETAPDFIVDEVLAKIAVIVEP